MSAKAAPRAAFYFALFLTRGAPGPYIGNEFLCGPYPGATFYLTSAVRFFYIPAK
jgi:hypothetical protein